MPSVTCKPVTPLSLAERFLVYDVRTPVHPARDGAPPISTHLELHCPSTRSVVRLLVHIIRLGLLATMGSFLFTRNVHVPTDVPRAGMVVNAILSMVTISVLAVCLSEWGRFEDALYRNLQIVKPVEFNPPEILQRFP